MCVYVGRYACTDSSSFCCLWIFVIVVFLGVLLNTSQSVLFLLPDVSFYYLLTFLLLSIWNNQRFEVF